ncbi:MAG TPA: hypothetical protein VF053_19750 [Streptosporangiales bacterium]
MVDRPEDDERPTGPDGETPAGQFDDLADAAEQFTADGDMDSRKRRKLLGRVVMSVGRNVGAMRSRGGIAGVMAGILEGVVPHLKVRDLETLRAHHHGLTGEALADSLVEHASRGSALVGAAGGALATVEYAAPPTLLSAPVQLATETVLVAAIEVKLVAELHEVYGVQVPGSGAQRGLAFLQAWGQQRGISPLQPGSVSAILGAGARRDLRQRLLARLGRNLTTLGPALTGAIAGGYLNRRGTKRLADSVRNDLRGRTLDIQ